ncbi:MAG: hypothetical protein ACRDPD_20885 [Streptosporangiaceae bacterium]
MNRGSSMIAKGFTPFSGAKVFAIMEISLGLFTLAWPLAWAPPWAYATAIAGAAAVLAAALAGWTRGPVLAVAAAVASCAFSRAGAAVLTAEGLLILGYLLAADAPAGLTRPGSWLRQQAFGGVAGLIASGAVLATLALHQLSSVWLTAAGLAAAAGAYLVALPLSRAGSRPGSLSGSRQGSDVDVQ